MIRQIISSTDTSYYSAIAANSLNLKTFSSFLPKLRPRALFALLSHCALSHKRFTSLDSPLFTHLPRLLYLATGYWLPASLLQLPRLSRYIFLRLPPLSHSPTATFHPHPTIFSYHIQDPFSHLLLLAILLPKNHTCYYKRRCVLSFPSLPTEKISSKFRYSDLLLTFSSTLAAQLTEHTVFLQCGHDWIFLYLTFRMPSLTLQTPRHLVEFLTLAFCSYIAGSLSY